MKGVMTMNYDDKQLLGDIYQLAETGIEATRTVLPKVEDAALKEELEEQYNDYSQAKAKSEQGLIDAGAFPKGNSPVQKAVMWGSIQMKTLSETSSEHIAEIMINGTTMGIVDLTKDISECSNASDSTKKFAQRFIHAEQRHIDNLKAFL